MLPRYYLSSSGYIVDSASRTMGQGDLIGRVREQICWIAVGQTIVDSLNHDNNMNKTLKDWKSEINTMFYGGAPTDQKDMRVGDVAFLPDGLDRRGLPVCWICEFDDPEPETDPASLRWIKRWSPIWWDYAD